MIYFSRASTIVQNFNGATKGDNLVYSVAYTKISIDRVFHCGKIWVNMRSIYVGERYDQKLVRQSVQRLRQCAD